MSVSHKAQSAPASTVRNAAAAAATHASSLILRSLPEGVVSPSVPSNRGVSPADTTEDAAERNRGFSLAVAYEVNDPDLVCFVCVGSAWCCVYIMDIGTVMCTPVHGHIICATHHPPTTHTCTRGCSRTPPMVQWRMGVWVVVAAAQHPHAAHEDPPYPQQHPPRHLLPMPQQQPCQHHQHHQLALYIPLPLWGRARWMRQGMGR